MPRARPANKRDPAYQAYLLLRVGFTVAPILFGVDKFLNWLVDWPIYLAPRDQRPRARERPSGDAGRGRHRDRGRHRRAVRPKFGGYLVAVWLAGIIINLLIQTNFYDIALRDLGLLIGALALAGLATASTVGRSALTVTRG